MSNTNSDTVSSVVDAFSKDMHTGEQANTTALSRVRVPTPTSPTDDFFGGLYVDGTVGTEKLAVVGVTRYRSLILWSEY